MSIDAAKAAKVQELRERSEYEMWMPFAESDDVPIVALLSILIDAVNGTPPNADQKNRIGKAASSVKTFRSKRAKVVNAKTTEEVDAVTWEAP